MATIVIKKFIKKYGEALLDLSETKSRWDMPKIWDITSYEYLDFALKDLEHNDRRNKINALSNTKRALHRRIDTLICYLWLEEISNKKRWNFPKKVDILSNFGIVTPDILSKINKFRNLIEHEYFTPPTKEEINDFIQIVELFLSSTDIILETPKIIEVPSQNLTFSFNLDKGIIQVLKQGSLVDKVNINSDKAWLDLSPLFFSQKFHIKRRLRFFGYIEDKEKTIQIIKSEIKKRLKEKYP